ncbi:helix-turn-helix transcriptional regulator [Nocardia sp. NPDC048505]|uniref:helix-turn-helix transcriptional regulator n=1 Tax=unclassified Nocardia TaxID=2637762 RepID=UPI0033DDA904
MTPRIQIHGGHCAYLGPPPRGALHSTSTAQLVVGVDAPIVLEVPGLPHITTYSTVVPARSPHRIHALGERVLLCYSDPAADTSARHLDRMRYRSGPFGLGHPREKQLIAAGTTGPLELEHVLDLACLAPAGTLDHRIARAAGTIRADPAAPHRAAAAAAALGMSTSYFLRLFAEHTATSYRRYIQWARILHAGTGIAHGHDFTSAATAAGFASPSHFSDVFRAMFGLTPSAVFTALAAEVSSDFPVPARGLAGPGGGITAE